MNQVFVDNAQIVNSNYTAYNGVIHVIDQCIAPSSSPESIESSR